MINTLLRLLIVYGCPPEARTAIETLRKHITVEQAENPEVLEAINKLDAWLDENDQSQNYTFERFERLKEFAREILNDFPEAALDGGDLQGIGEKHGLLVETKQFTPCSEYCSCQENVGYSNEEWSQGQTCYRFADWLSEVSMTEAQYKERFRKRLVEHWGMEESLAKEIANAAEFNPQDPEPEDHADDEVSYMNQDGQ